MIQRVIRVLMLLPVITSSVMAQGWPPSRKGTLVLSGGDLGSGVLERFVKLAGGPDARIVYIPTAASSLRLPSGFIYDPPAEGQATVNMVQFEVELAKMFGVKKVKVLHTRDRNVANSEVFNEPLKTADGVWLSSGNPGRLADAYLDTLVQRSLEAVLDRGGVIGGNSAGAIIQGSYIIRGRPDKPLLMVNGHERGFGYLKDVAIDPHLTEEKRFAELVIVVDAYPQLLGIGIDEKAAIVVEGGAFEVIGEGRVAIYDNQRHGGNWYYWLSKGDRFSLDSRKVVSTNTR